MAPRSHGATLPAWWLAYVNGVVASRDLTHADLEELLRQRGHAWDRSMISRFLLGKHTTLELATALADLLKIVRPIYLATSRLEAEAFEAVVRLRGGNLQ